MATGTDIKGGVDNRVPDPTLPGGMVTTPVVEVTGSEGGAKDTGAMETGSPGEGGATPGGWGAGRGTPGSGGVWSPPQHQGRGYNLASEAR